ncbi:MAG TPA: chemotaxis protein CheA [Thermoanaerobaculia bacterium]|nr:chemotaxis protein CheA [Thermoanaerobaculia bacterium]
MTTSDASGSEFDRKALLGVFLAEAEERLVQMEEALVALEEHPGDDELLQAIFRAAHTLKGNSATLGFSALTEFTHILEDLLERVRNRSLAVTPELVTLLLESVDALRQLLADAASGLDEMQPSHRALLARVSSAREQDAPGATRAAAVVHPRRRAADRANEVPDLNLPTRTLRVDVEKLDQMLDLVGEIAVLRGRLRQHLEHGGTPEAGKALEIHREADTLEADLQELVTRIRMIPIGPTLHQFARTVRDVSRALGKQVRLSIDGGEIELDMRVIEKIRDPLTHMVRNAVDHGIEAPDVRTAAGKTPWGTLRIRAYHDAGAIVIELSDDGAGINRRLLVERARALGLVGTDEPRGSEAFELVFAPGVSTAAGITELSGRGVGMDVVLRDVEALRGSIEVQSEPGRGTTFRIRLPLTLALIDGFVVRAAGESFVLPMDSVVECLDLPADARGAGLSGLMGLRGVPLPWLRLREHFDIDGPPSARENVVVVRSESGQAGFVVDALLGGHQVVIKPLGALFRGVVAVAGSAILGDGRAALILDVSKLLKQVLNERAPDTADPHGTLAAIGG